MRMAPLQMLFLGLGVAAFVAAVAAGTSHKVIVQRADHDPILRTYDVLSVVLGATAICLFTLTAWLHTRRQDRP